jgi:hypothetical protein
LNRKTAIVLGFLAFGLAVGIFTGWMVQSHHYDTPPFINLPGYTIGSLVFNGGWADYVVASTAF